MTVLLSRLILCLLLVMTPLGEAPQQDTVLHITVVLRDANGKPIPVPHHALLISDNPSSAPPRRIVTALDGTANPRLRPGNYTVESDQPVAFQGKVYQWTQTLDVPAGREATLELTADNAEVTAGASSGATSAAPMEDNPSGLLMQWQDSVVVLWTPAHRASGFLVSASGLVATSQRAVGNAMSVEVQLTPAIKVAANIVSADPVRDVAILRVNPATVATLRPVPLPCSPDALPSVAEGQDIFTIGAPLRALKSMTSASVSRIEPHAIVSDFRLDDGAVGGPVFTAAGVLIGITSIATDVERASRGYSTVVRIADACEVARAAETKTKDAAAPSAAHLPVEPERPFPADALNEVAKRGSVNVTPYRVSSSSFDVTFITPVLTYAAQSQAERSGGRDRAIDARKPEEELALRALTEFGSWNDYVAGIPPVVIVRVTPRLVEGFWKMLARGAAQTQGVTLPPLKSFKPGFLRLRAFCGDAEVTSIHPFTLVQRLSDTEAISEGLYVFEPGAFGPHCGTVKLLLYSEKEPQKGESVTVEARTIQQVWQDFAPYR